MTTHVDYYNRETTAVQTFLDGLKNAAKTEGAVLDSAAAADFVSNATHQHIGVEVPAKFQAVLDEAKDDQERNILVKAILDCVSDYEAKNAVACPADLVQQAFHSAYSTTQKALDSVADNAHSDPRSLQPNRAVVSILATFAEAVPFAHYLPADIGSNEAKLAILSHQCGSDMGAYARNSILDGISAGEPYLSAARVHTAAPSADGKVTGKITKIQETRDTCKQDAGDLKLLRGRTLVYINGLPVATETSTAGSGASVIAGKANVDGKEYAIGGTINTDTGAFELTTSPALPDTVPVTVEAFIDFERDADITPEVISSVETFSLFAKPWRGFTRVSLDASTQMGNELNLDPLSESIVATQNQYAMERYYDVLAKGLRIAALSKETFDFAVARAHQDSARSEVWRDLSYPLGLLSQQMAETTMDHGITHLYVTKRVAAQLRQLPSTYFQSSGIVERPGVFRVGRLFGQYEVYYTPKILSETESSAQILCVGRASNVGRNPIVMGDAVAPSVIPLAVGHDMRRGAAFYARNFTCVNPHAPSARGFALIEVTNMNQ